MKLIPLTRGYSALVDDEDFERVSNFSWYALIQPKIHKTAIYAARSHYANKTIGKPLYSRMRRFILSAPKDMQVDHIDGDGLNNQKSNLRIVTNQQNQFNVRPKTKSGYKGVTFVTNIRHKNLKRRYVAHIMFNRKAIHLGYHLTAEEAAKVYDKKARELFGEFAYTNF